MTHTVDAQDASASADVSMCSVNNISRESRDRNVDESRQTHPNVTNHDRIREPHPCLSADQRITDPRHTRERNVVMSNTPCRQALRDEHDQCEHCSEGTKYYNHARPIK